MSVYYADGYALKKKLKRIKKERRFFNGGFNMKTTELNFGISNRINEMISLGMKKKEMIESCKKQYKKEHGSDEDWEDYMAMKNECLRSTNSIQTMRAAQKPFVAWAKSQQVPLKKFEKITRDDLCRYLVDRSIQVMPGGTERERSAWVISRDLHFCNKVFFHLTKDNPITKKELKLKLRSQNEVVRGRSNNGVDAKRKGLWEKCKDQITVARGTGMRRESMTKITYGHFKFNKEGLPVQIHLVEKGGRPRDAYILPRFQEEIKAIIEPHKGSDKPIFSFYDSHVNNHRFRHEYAMELLAQVIREHENGEPYFQGDAKPIFKLTEKEKNRKTWRGIDVIVCGLVSQMLGHNRVEVLKSYIW
jgi:hypothetical protein